MARGIEFVFDASTRQMAAGLRAGREALEEMSTQARQTDASLRAIKNDINVRPDLDRSALAALKVRLRAEKDQLEAAIGDVNVDIDTFGAMRDLKRIERELRRLDLMDVDVDVDVDRDGVARMAALEAGLRGVGSGLAALGANPYVAAAGLTALAGAAGAAAVPLAGLGAALAGGFGAFKLLDEVAQIEALERRFATVFGNLSDDIGAWVDDLNEAAGVSELELGNIAAGIQDVLIPVGFSRADAADITQALTERAVALAQFTGVDVERASQAITSALVGEREALKSLGVVIKKSDVNQWIEDNAKAVERLSGGEATAVATLALIEQRSTDAWDAYSQGVMTAQGAVNSARATFSDFKNDLAAGLGQVATGIVDDLDLSGIQNPLDSIITWIGNNQNTLRSFFLDLGDVVLAGADTFLVFAQSAVDAFLRAWPAIDQFINLTANAFAALLEASGRLADPTGILGIRDDMYDMAAATRDFADSTREAGDAFVTDIGPAISSGLAQGRDTIAGIRDELAGLKDTTLEIKTKVERGGVAAVRADIAALSSTQAIDLALSIDPKSEDAVDRRLRALAVEQIVDVVPAVTDVDQAEELLSQIVSKPRQAKILAEALTEQAEGNLADAAANRVVQLLAEGKTAKAEATLDRAAQTRDAQIVAYANTIQAEYDLDRLTADRYANLYINTVNPGGPIQEPGWGDATRSSLVMPRITIDGREVGYIVEDTVQRARDSRALQDILAGVP